MSLSQQIKTKWGFSLQWPDMVSHLATRCLGGTSDQMSAWQEAWPNVNLTQSLIFGWRDMCDVYYFYTHLKLWRLISLFILLFFYTFLSGNIWNRLWVKWHGMADEPHPQGRNFIAMLQKYFWSTFHSLSPQIFFNIVNVSGIEIHLKFTFPYHFYINVKLLEG